MKITYLRHAAFYINDTLLIDPFINHIPEASIILVTHDHQDHLGNTIEIAKKNNATVVAIFELSNYLSEKGLNTIGMNVGGTISLKGYKIKMVNAIHSCNRGRPVGFVIEYEGKKVYHAGDTSLFYDMKLIGEEGIDVALLPIGGTYTMDIEEALRAIELLNPKYVIPMHYSTFPAIKADPEILKSKSKAEVIILNPGETFEL